MSRKAFALLLGMLVAAAITVVVRSLYAERNSLSGEAWAALREAKDFEIVSLQPEMSGRPAKDKIRNWIVLGRAKVTSKRVRDRLLEALEQAIADKHRGMMCFLPRHAILASHEGHDFQVLICFQCGWVRSFRDGKPQKTVRIGRAGQEVFDRAYRDAGLKIAPLMPAVKSPSAH